MDLKLGNQSLGHNMCFIARRLCIRCEERPFLCFPRIYDNIFDRMQHIVQTVRPKEGKRFSFIFFNSHIKHLSTRIKYCDVHNPLKSIEYPKPNPFRYSSSLIRNTSMRPSCVWILSILFITTPTTTLLNKQFYFIPHFPPRSS